jgi:hypothetical protein
LSRRLSIVSKARESDSSALQNLWWPFPGVDRGSSLDIHSHQLSDTLAKEDEELLSRVRRLSPYQKGHRRHFSAATITKTETELLIGDNEGERILEEEALVTTPQAVDSGFLYPPPLPNTRAPLKRGKTKRPEIKRRKTVYKPFSEEDFGKRLAPPKPEEKQKSMLAELPFEVSEELNRMKNFKFPGSKTRRHSPVKST